MEKRHDDGPVPPTQTSASFRGGAPPIPPHNKPPTRTALMTPDPEDDPVRDVIECASEEEARATIRQMGYFVTRARVRKNMEARAEPAEREKPTAWGSALATIADAIGTARDRLVEFVDAFNEGARMAAGASKKHPSVLP